MSYAIIQTGGKQYKVKSGEILKIEKLPDSKPGTQIEFKDILAYGDNKIIEEKIQKGHPTIPSKIQDEIECNIFLKAVSLEVFSKLRDLKDNF